MKASQLIIELKAIIAEHGDLEVRPRETENIFCVFDIDHVKIAPACFYGENLIDPSSGKFILLGWEE